MHKGHKHKKARLGKLIVAYPVYRNNELKKYTELVITI